MKGNLIVVTLFALAALAPRAPGAEPLEATLRLGDYRFRPDTLEVEAGRAVELTLLNEDALTPHNLRLKAPAAGLDIDIDTDIQPGQSVTIRIAPTAAGTYEFWCDKKLLFFQSHREKGMEGKLIVR